MTFICICDTIIILKTQLVSQIILSNGTTLSYGYDAEERITSVVETYTVDDTPVTNTTLYTYDALGQLITEKVNNVVVNTMTYDNYGNIKTKNGISYTYDTTWKDLLLQVGTGENSTISYDYQGNPLTYLGHTLTWEKGRQLKSFDGNTYTYNANGIRTSKIVNGIKHEYTLDGTKILRETWNGNTLIPLYDNEDGVCGILYNNVPYYFIKNLQGDVIAVVNEKAETVARYFYDAWGICTVTQDSVGIATINPFRYRGYYYDEEIALYYLQSRYYDPQVGRFINGDIPEMCNVSSLYRYCSNIPIIYADYHGFKEINVLGHKVTLTNVGFNMIVSSCLLLKNHVLELAKKIISLEGSTNKYKNMDNVRIAKEVLAHAVLYYMGVGASIVSTISNTKAKLNNGIISQIYALQFEILSRFSTFLITRSYKIDVNNNESTFRLFVYNIIWMLMPNINGKCTSQNSGSSNQSFGGSPSRFAYTSVY